MGLVEPSSIYLIEIEDDFVEKAQALHTLVVRIQFHVEFVELRQRDEYDT